MHISTSSNAEINFIPSLDGLIPIPKPSINTNTNISDSSIMINTQYSIENNIYSLVEPRDTSIDGGTDLIPGVYEGGFKLWECSIDLSTYILQNYDSLLSTGSVSGGSNGGSSRVLDLGCGHGILGICCASPPPTTTTTTATSTTTNPPHITFIDLNQEVIEQVTWPNIQLNLHSHNITDSYQNIKCYCGDFRHLPYIMKNSNHTSSNNSSNDINPINEEYDLILSSETIYTVNLCYWIIEIIKSCLKFNTGIALIATKRYYFGVGGGTNQFLLDIEKASSSLSTLTATVIQSYEDGISNIRDIILIKKIKK